jgi:hypothetical protein
LASTWQVRQSVGWSEGAVVMNHTLQSVKIGVQRTFPITEHSPQEVQNRDAVLRFGVRSAGIAQNQH